MVAAAPRSFAPDAPQSFTPEAPKSFVLEQIAPAQSFPDVQDLDSVAVTAANWPESGIWDMTPLTPQTPQIGPQAAPESTVGGPTQAAGQTQRGPDNRVGLGEKLRDTTILDALALIPYSPYQDLERKTAALAQEKLAKGGYGPAQYQMTPMGGYAMVRPPETTQGLQQVTREYQEKKARGETAPAAIFEGTKALVPYVGEFAVGGAGAKSLGIAEKGVKAAAAASGVRTALQPQRVASALADQQKRGETGATAILKAYGDAYIENLSETAGGAVPAALKKLPLGGKLLNAMSDIARKTGMPENELVRRISTKAGWNGLLGEWGEERLNTVLKSVTDIDDFGAGKDSNPLQRLAAGMQQDLQAQNQLVELGVLSVPGATKLVAQKVMGAEREPKPVSFKPDPVQPETIQLSIGPKGELIETPVESLPTEQKQPVPPPLGSAPSKAAPVIEPKATDREAGAGQKPNIQRTRNDIAALTDEQLVQEALALPKTHAVGVGMGQNEFAGTFISTEQGGNRYADVAQGVQNVTAQIRNPKVFRTATEYAAFHEQFLPAGFNQDDMMGDLRNPADQVWAESARKATEALRAQGYDSVYLPESEGNEGILVVFDRGAVKEGTRGNEPGPIPPVATTPAAPAAQGVQASAQQAPEVTPDQRRQYQQNNDLTDEEMRQVSDEDVRAELQQQPSSGTIPPVTTEKGAGRAQESPSPERPGETPKTLPALLSQRGRQEVEGLIGEWDQNARLSEDGKYITTYADPRNLTHKVRANTKEFLSWLTTRKPEAEEAPAAPADTSWIPAKIQQQLDEGDRPGVDAQWVDSGQVKLPVGYVKEGNTYRFQKGFDGSPREQGAGTSYTDVRSYHIPTEKSRKKYDRNSSLEALQAGHTLAKVDGKPRYIFATAGGYTVSDEVPPMQNHFRVMPNGTVFTVAPTSEVSRSAESLAKGAEQRRQEVLKAQNAATPPTGKPSLQVAQPPAAAPGTTGGEGKAAYLTPLDEWRPIDAFKPIREAEPGRAPVFDVSLNTRAAQQEMEVLQGTSLYDAGRGQILAEFDRTWTTADARAALDEIQSRVEGREWEPHEKAVKEALASGDLTPKDAVKLHKSSYPDLESWPEYQEAMKKAAPQALAANGGGGKEEVRDFYRGKPFSEMTYDEYLAATEFALELPKGAEHRTIRRLDENMQDMGPGILPPGYRIGYTQSQLVFNKDLPDAALQAELRARGFASSKDGRTWTGALEKHYTEADLAKNKPEVTNEPTETEPEEASPEPAGSAQVQSEQANPVVPKSEPAGELDPSKYEDATEITRLHAEWVNGSHGLTTARELNIVPDRTVWEGIHEYKREQGADGKWTWQDYIDYPPAQVAEAYRTVQKPVPSPMADTQLFAMPGHEKEMEAVGKKMAGLKSLPSQTAKAATLPRAPSVPKADKTKEGGVKAVHEASATESSRYAINGVYVEGDTIVATDGRRLFAAKEKKGFWGKDGLYAGASLKKGLLKEKGEGNFPKWRNVVPLVSEQDAIRVEDLPQMWRRVRQAMTMTSEEGYGPIVVLVLNNDGTLGFASGAPDAGHVEINVKEGGKILGGVNGDFLLDAIAFHAKRGDNALDMFFAEADKPMMTRSQDGKNLTVTMSVNIGDTSALRAAEEAVAVPNPSVTSALQSRDFDQLKALLGEGQDANRAQFTKETGVTLPDSVAGTENAIGEWVRRNKETGGGAVGFPGSRLQASEIDRGRLQVAMEPRAKPISAREILDYVRRAFAVPMKGKATHRMQALGWFDPKAVGIRLKDARSLTTAIHELGHYIDWHTNERWSKKPPSKAIADELMALGKALYGNRKPEGGYKSEGWAEFMREYVTGEDAQTKAPNLYAFFTGEYLPNNPETAREIGIVKQMVADFRFQGAEARVESQINRKAIKGPISERATALLQWANTVFRDELAVFKRVVQATGLELSPSRNPYDLAVAFADKAGSKARQFVLSGTTDLAGNRKGPSLREALAGIPRGDLKTFTRWIYAKEALFRWSQGKNPGISKADAQYVYEKYKSPEWEDAADKVTQWNRDVLDYLVDAGGFNPKVRDMLRDTPVYIPLFRAFSKEETRPLGSGGGRGLQPGKPVKKMKGSGRETIDPFESMIQQCERFISVSHKSMVAKALADLAEVPGMAGWIWKVPAPQQAVKFTSEKIKDDIRRIAVERLGLDPSEIPTDFTEPWDDMLTIWQNASDYYGKDNIVSLFVNGERQWFEVQPDLYRAIQGLDQYTLPWYLSLFGKATRGVRLGATGLNASFGLIRNFVRDSMAFMVTGEHARLGPISAIKGVAHDVLGTETARRFKALGGEMSGQVLNDRVATQRLRDELTGNWAIKTAKHPIEALRELFGITELGPRIAEFEKALEEGERRYGKGTLDASIYALNAAQDVTTNFTRHGQLAKVLNQLIPFFNAAIQGPDKIIRTFSQHPARATATALAGLTLPALLLWWLGKDDEWYDHLSDQEKASYLHFRIPGTEKIVRLPIPFELGYLFQALPVSVVDRLYRKDKGQVQDILKIAAERSNPLSWPAAVGPAIDVMTNKSWSGLPIVSEAMKQKLPEDRVRPYTTAAMKYVGRQIGVAPVQLEYLADAYSGGLYSRIGRMADLAGSGGEGKTISDVPVIGTLFARETERPNEKLDQLYTRLDLLNQKAGSKKATVPELYERHALTKVSLAISKLRKEAEVEGVAQAKKKEIFQKMGETLDEVLEIQDRGVTDKELLSWLGDNTYQAYAKPSAATGWIPHLPGQAVEGSEELVDQLEAELRRRAQETKK